MNKILIFIMISFLSLVGILKADGHKPDIVDTAVAAGSFNTLVKAVTAADLVETLKSKGLVAIEVNAGDAFDAEKHEAITQIPAGEDQSGKIVDVTEQGYQLGEKIIRYPKVVVGQ